MEELAKPENLDKAQHYIDFVKNNLEPLAEHLKVSVEWLWNILVMQARVEAIVYLIVCIGMFITTVVLSRVFFKALKKAKFQKGFASNTKVYKHKKTGAEIDSSLDDWDNSEQYESVAIKNEKNSHGYIAYISGAGLALMLLTSVVTTASSLQVIVTGLVNPEFRAIEKIVEYAKPQVSSKAEGKQ